MNQHLSHEDLVLRYYGEPDLGAAQRAHLESCAQCGSELASLAAVLDRVTPVDVPEPAADYEQRTWDRVQWRLRGERRTQSHWTKWVAAAAMMTIAFIGGLLWNRRNTEPQPIASTTSTTSTAATTVAAQPAQQAAHDRVLLVVVGEHFDESERVLMELTNITPKNKGTNDITSERVRAEELLASNRLYRTSAEGRGEEDVATLLDELEPVLMQIAHSPSQVSGDELRSMQKRVETKGLVFKLRVVRADVHRTTRTSPQTSI